MKYRFKRHLTSVLLYDLLLIGLVGMMTNFTKAGALIFGIAGVILIASDRIVEDRHLKVEEQRAAQAY